MSDNLERLVNTALGIAAIAVTAVLVHREFSSRRPVLTIGGPSAYMAEWKTFANAGRLMGDSAAPIQLIEFADLECPFCAQFNSSLRKVREAFPRELAYVFVHFPLATHRFAQPAALAAECAGSQGRFVQMVDAIYSKQDSLGLRPWTAYARDVAIGDTLQFLKCLSSPDRPLVIAAGTALAHRVGVSVTPTIVLNGWRFGYAPADTELIRAIKDILGGRRPYPGFPTPH